MVFGHMMFLGNKISLWGWLWCRLLMTSLHMECYQVGAHMID